LSEEGKKFEYKDIKVEPTQQVVPPERATTLVADYVKCAIDFDTGLCTFIFFKKHFVPKHTDIGLQIDQITHKPFLEIKVPLSTALALVAYMKEFLEGKREQRGVYFGPVGILPKR